MPPAERRGGIARKAVDLLSGFVTVPRDAVDGIIWGQAAFDGGVIATSLLKANVEGIAALDGDRIGLSLLASRAIVHSVVYRRDIDNIIRRVFRKR